MNQPDDYIILFSHNPDNLSKDVLTQIRNGYYLIGGISQDGQGRFAQALGKDAGKKEPALPKEKPAGATVASTGRIPLPKKPARLTTKKKVAAKR